MTLEEFIKNAKQLDRMSISSYVEEQNFESLYVRFRKMRLYLKNPTDILTNNIKNEYKPTLDLANATVIESLRGTGIFTNMVKRIRGQHPDIHIHAESVLSARFRNHLRELGFLDTHIIQCLILPALY